MRDQDRTSTDDGLTVPGRFWLDFSGVDPDYGVSWEIDTLGVRGRDWKLRDPETGVSGDGRTYREAVRKATALRDMYRRVQSIAEDAVRDETRRLAREIGRAEVGV